jgi:hypothetical protein
MSVILQKIKNKAKKTGIKRKSKLKQETTNNPAKRPVRSKNKLPNQVKKALKIFSLTTSNS